MAFPPKQTAPVNVPPPTAKSPSGPPQEPTGDDTSPYPQIDDFLATLDPDELAYLKDKCESLYPTDNTAMGQSSKGMVSEKDFM